MTVGFGIKPGLLELAVTLSGWLSFAVPEPIPLRLTVWSPASSLIARLPIGFKVGGSFTGLTVRTKVKEALPPFVSVTMFVIVAVPN